MDKWTFINDRFLPEEKAVLHFRDLSVQRGYGIFDFLKFVNDQPVFIEEHLNRFYFSASEMRLQCSLSRDEIKDVITELIRRNDISEGGIRITLTGGYSQDGYQLSEPNLIIAFHNVQKPSKEQFDKGLKLMTYPHQRQLPHVKTIDYLMAIWLQPIIEKNNADDVLYHTNGNITECPRSNFFIVTAEDRIVTPAENILKGISRMKLIESAKDHFEIEERNLTMNDIRNAKEAFISSTTKLLLPVSRIDNHAFAGNNIITRKLYEVLSRLAGNKVDPVV